jgi:hypothetical protein
MIARCGGPSRTALMRCGGTMAAATTWTTTHFISSLLGLFLFKLCKRSSNLNENHPFFVFEIF